MDAGQKKIVLDDEQVEEMDKMADFVVSIYDNIRELEEKTMRFSHYLENLAKRMGAIKDKTKADEFSQSLLYLSDCFYNISQQNEKIALALYKKGCLEIADDLAVQAENMAEQEIKKENLKNDWWSKKSKWESVWKL